MKYEIEIPDGVIPDGWEPTGHYRNVYLAEIYLGNGGATVWNHSVSSEGKYLILRKVEPVRAVGYMPCAITSYYTSVGQLKEYYPNSPVIRIDYENGKPVSVTLEPVESQ